jgi:hypothetical protein
MHPGPHRRVLGEQRAVVAFNISDAPREVSVAAADGRYRVAFPAGGGLSVAGGRLAARLPPRAARVWILDSSSE